jgi:threonine/homoserine/homoserine lactone efflux protein
VLVIVATSIQAGKRRGLQTVAGTSLAMALQLTVAALATSGLLVVLNVGLLWLKWAGVAYLAILGVRTLLQIRTARTASTPTGIGSFQRGFWISLTNPKTIFFFSAFLPQFVSADGNAVIQLGMLSMTFWCLAVLLDSGYVLLADRMRWLWVSKTGSKVLNGITGSVYLTASALLASSSKA